MQPVVTCLHNVLWREVGELPEPPLKRDEWVNYTAEPARPKLGEVRWIRVEHPYQVEVGQRTWALFQNWQAFTSGIDEGVDSHALVEVEILEQTKPKTFAYATQAYWAKVRCFEPIELTDIPRYFSESSPDQWFSQLLWPDEILRVYISKFKNLHFYQIVTQEARRFFITTGAAPERIVLRGLVVFDDPIEICNCPFEFSKWPHRLLK